MAQLFSPEIVFRHISEPPECAQFTGARDVPASFLKHFAVQSAQRAFAGVNSASGQLDFRLWAGLASQKQLTVTWQNGVCAGAHGVFLPTDRGLADTSNHALPLSVFVSGPI